jgi:RHH-type proline utilization regulon transcriptional repressor/proline dehydrogenase/delta 1-pyrroline-5-carboxylate dehydrogenase
MDLKRLDPKIQARGREFFASIRGEAPSIFNKGWWSGKVMDWAMQHEDFKVKLFRFVDVMPTLTTTESLTRHIEEYFAGEGGGLPPVMAAGLKAAGLAGKLGAGLMAKGIRSNIEGMGRQFIVGETAAEAVKNIERLRKDGFAFTIDVLGEATVSEAEADARLAEHLELLDGLGAAQAKWNALGNVGGRLDWGGEPMLNLSVKPTAFCSQLKARDLAGSVDGIAKRLLQVLVKVRDLGGAACIDMESLDYKEITLALYRRLRSCPELHDWPHLAVVLQAYLASTEQDARELVNWARQEKLPITVRLVKGAYWDYETVRAKQNGWPVPVWTHKAETDACYERVAAFLLENADLVRLACGSHNVRTIAAVMEIAQALGVPENRYEFQVLYGMAEPVRKGLKNVAGRVRLYCPYGQLIPGMAYLVRRLLENTANESFLRQSFAGEADMARLLEDPHDAAERARREAPAPKAAPAGLLPFANQAPADFTLPEVRAAYPKALAEVRDKLGQELPLRIAGQEVRTGDLLDSYNPARTTEVVARVHQAGIPEVEAAIAAAKTVFPAWRNTPAAERAGVLFKAADLARARMYELAAWQVIEVGKQWDQAHADVAEAIDFLEYYGREMLRLGSPRRMGRAPGEMSQYLYRPKGLAAVIAPWNFPLAISCGMAAAAIVAGNCVLYKPSGLSLRVGWCLAELFRDAGLPEGVFTYLPGRGAVMGDALVGHKDIHAIAFTGSVETGLRIIKTVAEPAPGQDHVKKVVAEMGGKNAIIVDDDAELDEAVAGVLYSAFGFQGQKCSACSRVIVLDAVYDTFVRRLVAATDSLKLGPAEDPANAMGPVVDKAAKRSIMNYVELAGQEGKVLLKKMPAQCEDDSCWAPLTIVEGITPEHRIAQEEVFGPVLAIMRATNFDQAIAWANSTKFALTGAVYSRSPRHLEQARREFECGNLYLNRNSVGALVERHPFGGYKLSGIGSKAGGPDYLLQFMDPVTVTENTMRRGFTPIAADDDWV